MASSTIPTRLSFIRFPQAIWRMKMTLQPTKRKTELNRYLSSKR